MCQFIIRKPNFLIFLIFLTKKQASVVLLHSIPTNSSTNVPIFAFKSLPSSNQKVTKSLLSPDSILRYTQEARSPFASLHPLHPHLPPLRPCPSLCHFGLIKTAQRSLTSISGLSGKASQTTATFQPSLKILTCHRSSVCL